MSMFKIDELAGTLIKSGRFNDAIPVVRHELSEALYEGVISQHEFFGDNGIMQRFCAILLNPSDVEAVRKLGDDLIYIAIRLPNYVEKVY